MYFRNWSPVDVALSFIACHGIWEAFREGDEITNGGVASIGVDDYFTCVVHHAPEAIELILQIACTSRLEASISVGTITLPSASVKP